MFIVLEGLDGAGKSTQIRMLRQLLAERGVESEYVHFPRFDAPVYGELIARFLRGEFGGVNEVDPYLVALLFAGDRRRPARDPGVDRRRQSRGPRPLRLFERGFPVCETTCRRAARPPRAVDSGPGIRLQRPAAPRSVAVPRRAVRLHRTKAHGGPRGRRPRLPARQPGHSRRRSRPATARARRCTSPAAAKDDSLRVVDCSDPSGAMGSPEHNFEKIRAVLAPILDAR